MNRLFYTASHVYPGRFRQRVDVLLTYCGSDMDSRDWLGRGVVISSLVFTFSAVLFYLTVENFVNALLLILVGLVMFQLASIMSLYFKADSRGKAVEKVLPNFLQLVAANLNSGMTPFQAFKESSRMEFGILKDEVDRTIALSLGSMPFHDALEQMPPRIKSQMFKNVVELFVEGMKTGGPLATLLNDIAKDIFENLDMRREIVTRSRSYIIFISFIVVFGAPLLSAVSIHFIRTIDAVIGEVAAEIPEIQVVGGVSFGELALTPEFLAAVTVINLTVTGLIASWLLAIIADGKDRYVIKYAMAIIPAAIVMFYILDYAIRLILGSPI